MIAILQCLEHMGIHLLIQFQIDKWFENSYFAYDEF